MNERAAPYQIRPRKEEPASATEVIGAAFRLENDIVNWLDYSGRGRHAVDTDFDIADAAASSPLWDAHGERLSQAQSMAEFRSIEARLQREQADRELLGGAGLGGMAAGMLAASFSPVMFVPLTGQARGSRGVAQAFALAGAAATTQEAVLLLNQELRTSVEAGIGIAAGTVLGGLLGSAAVYLRRGDREALAQSIRWDAPPRQPGMIVRNEDGSYTRTTPGPELQFPAGTVRSPSAVLEVQRTNAAFAEVQRAIATGNYPALRALIDNPATSFEARGFAQDVLERANVGARAQAAAARLDLPEGVAQEWGTYTQQLSEAPADAPMPADVARRELFEGLEAAGVQPEQMQPLVARLQAEAQPGPVRGASEIAEELRNEQIAPHIISETEARGGSVGARARDEQQTPMLPVRDPETGELTYEPLIDPNVAPDPGVLAKDVGGVLTQIGRVSPVLRTIQQPGMPIKAHGVRRSMLQMSDNGNEFTGAEFGIPPAPGGTTEHRLGFFYGRMAESFRIQRDAYMRYLERPDNFRNRMLTDFQATFSIRPGAGKLSFAEFKEQVVDAFHNGRTSPIKEANEVVGEWNKSFFDAFNEAMLEATEGRGAKALYELLDDADPAKSYFTHIFSVDKISRDREGFINMVRDHYQSAAAAVAGRRWQKMQARAEQEASYEDLLRLDAESTRFELDAIEESLAGLKDIDNTSPQVQRIRDLRDRRRMLRDEEYERLLDEEMRARGEPDADRDRSLQVRARSNVKEAYDALTEEINQLEAALPSETQALLDRRKALRSRRAMIHKSFGAIEERQARGMAQIERNEELNLRAIESFERKALALHGKLGRISDKDLDDGLAQLEAQFDKAMRTLEKSDARIEKLSREIGTEFEPTEKLSIANAQRQMREARAEKALERYSKAASYDREGARQALEERLQLARQYLAKVNGARSERNARLRERIREQDPARATAQIEGMSAAREAREEAFIDWLAQAGADDFDLQAGTFDFSRSARDLASELSYKITGSPLRIGQLDLLPELKGPMKRRVLDIEYDTKKAFLELDSERVLARYTRSMGADIELYRAFGSVSGRNMLVNAQEELARIESTLRTRTVDENGKAITEAQRNKQIKAHEAGSKLILRDLEHTVTRIRGMAGLPSDPSSFWYRAGRAAMLFNVPIMMGSAAVTSIPDMGRPVMVHGMMRTFRDGWMPLIGGLVDSGQRQLNQAQIRQLNLANIGVEVFSQQRAQAGFDITMDTAGRNRFERGLEFISQKTPVVALFGPWTDWNKTLAGMVTMPRMLDGIDQLASGRMRPNDPELAYLTSTGLTPQLMERIAAQFNAPEGHTVVRGTKVPSMENWKDYEALRAFTAAMQRESDRLVITPGLERARVADEHILGRLFMQFRSFTMGAHSKILISGLQQRDTAAFHALSGVVFSLALGALSYYIWARTTSERATQEMLNAGWETWMDQAIYRSGLLGLFSEVQSVGSKIPATADYVTFAGSDLAGRRPNSIISAIAGPTYGTAETVASVMAGMDSPTQGTLSQARKLVPYQNVFYLRRALDMVEEGLGNTLGLPERRQ